MEWRRKSTLSLFAYVAFIVVGPSSAQGTFVNFEVPQIAPITIATVQDGPGFKSYVLACNTPDNSVEIYNAESTAFVARVPVGLGPVTVRWNNTLQKFFTCNFIGDSISSVELAVVSGGLEFALERTVNLGNDSIGVGDEPTDIVFLPGTAPPEAAVSLHSQAAIMTVRLDDLTSLSKRVLAHPSTQPNDAVKAPRRLEVLPTPGGYELLALNTMGGNKPSAGGNGHYDMDLFIEDHPTLATQSIGGMGSTNMAFALDPVGNRVFVVGGFATNLETIGEANLESEPFGFVETFLWVVNLQGTCGVNPAPCVEGEPSLNGGVFQTWQTVNLNRDYLSGGPLSNLSERVSQPSDIALITDGGGNVQQLVIACFGSDKVLILTPEASANGGYLRTHVDLGAADLGTGARGLAYDEERGRVWVLNRLDNSLAWFDFQPGVPPAPEQIRLQRDPTPDTIRDARKFLYSAHLTSGNRMVACASCHVDGRTDGLLWDLGDPLNPGGQGEGPFIPPELLDIIPYFGILNPTFSPKKGPLITQSLQGLVNSHIDTSRLQYITTNAPYHWRGDRPRFVDFNQAFVKLQGMPNIGSPVVFGEEPEFLGISKSQMRAYRNFVNTIHYPPNPEQPDDRRYATGSGARRGLQVFHEVVSLTENGVDLSCANCHPLPDGSSNTFTLENGGANVPLENAATRGLFQREQALIPKGSFIATGPTNWTRLSQRGLTHDGRNSLNADEERSINDFIALSFGNLSSTELSTLIEFSRHLDWGVDPMIGRVLTVDEPLWNSPSNTVLDDISEFTNSSKEANSGLAVYVRFDEGTKVRGYWYDCSMPSPIFRNAIGTKTKTETDLLGLLKDEEDDLLIFQAVPTGSERRVAHLTGTPLPLGDSSINPANLELLPMVPNTAFEPVTGFTANVNPEPSGPNMVSIRRRVALEDAIRNGSNLFGLSPSLRHEPPRRFRIAGDNIHHGAKLRLGMKKGDPLGTEIAWAEFDLAATSYRVGQKVVWETAEELDASMTMAFLNGGPEIDPVAQLLAGELDSQISPGNPPASLQPLLYNDFTIEVVNQNGSVGQTSGVQLTIGDMR